MKTDPIELISGPIHPSSDADLATRNEISVFDNFDQFPPSSSSPLFIFFEGTSNTYQKHTCFMDPIAARIATQFPTLILNGVGTVEAFIKEETKVYTSELTRNLNKVHGLGFLSFEYLPNYLMNYLQPHLGNSHDHKTPPIFITGHSRGAVNALNMAKELLKSYPNVQIDLFMHDPVIGPGFTLGGEVEPEKYFKIPNEIRKTHLVSMLNEERDAFIGTINKLNSPGDYTHILLPGNHATNTICIKDLKKQANPILLTYMLSYEIHEFLKIYQIDNSLDLHNIAIAKKKDIEIDVLNRFYDPDQTAHESKSAEPRNDYEYEHTVLQLINQSMKENELTSEASWKKISGGQGDLFRDENRYLMLLLNGIGGEFIATQVRKVYPKIAKIYFDGHQLDENDIDDIKNQIHDFSQQYPYILNLINFSRSYLQLAVTINEQQDLNLQDSQEWLDVKQYKHEICIESLPSIGQSVKVFRERFAYTVALILGSTSSQKEAVSKVQRELIISQFKSDTPLEITTIKTSLLPLILGGDLSKSQFHAIESAGNEKPITIELSPEGNVYSIYGTFITNKLGLPEIRKYFFNPPSRRALPESKQSNALIDDYKQAQRKQIASQFVDVAISRALSTLKDRCASLTITRVTRGFLARKQLARTKSASLIAKIVRGYLARTKLAARTHDAASLIAKTARSYLTHKQLAATVSPAVERQSTEISAPTLINFKNFREWMHQFLANNGVDLGKKHETKDQPTPKKQDNKSYKNSYFNNSTKGLLSCLSILGLFSFKLLSGYQGFILNSMINCVSILQMEAIISGIYSSIHSHKMKISNVFAKSYSYIQNNIKSVSGWMLAITGGSIGLSSLKLISPRVCKQAINSAAFISNAAKKRHIKSIKSNFNKLFNKILPSKVF